MMKRKAMRLKKKTKKNTSKGGVAKAVRYDDGREGDAITKALRRFESGGSAWGIDPDSDLRDQNYTSQNYDTNNNDDGNNDGGNNDGGKNEDTGDGFKGPKKVWDTDGDGKLSKKEKKNRKEYLSKADADGDGKFSKEERKDARQEYKGDLKEQKQEEKEKKKKRKYNKQGMIIDNFKEQRAKRMDQIADNYNQRVKDLIKKGYPKRDALVKAAYDKIKNVDPVGQEMLDDAKDTATSVNKQYKKAKKYDKTDFKDIEGRADEASRYDKVGFEDVEDMAREANYNKTDYADLEGKARRASKYDTGEFSSEDYTTGDIQKRMSPYEELVAERARQRLKRDYEEGRGQRETEAARAGAFGGSAAAVKEMADRRNYRDALKDLNAESLQKAFESGANLTNLADDSRYRADAATEQSRQYGADLGMKGWEAQLAARNATSNEEARLAEQQLQQATLTGNLRQQAAAEEANQTQYGLAGVEQIQKARDSAANEVARAKEAELAGIAGQGSTAQLMSGLSDQELRQYLGKADAMNVAGQQKMDYQLARQEYPLSLQERNMNINTSAVSGTPLNTTVKPSEPSKAQTYLGYAALGASALGSVADAAKSIGSLFADGGPVHDPRTARRQPLVVNLANGGIVDLHNAMFRRK